MSGPEAAALTDGGACDCACHTTDAESGVCPGCVERHSIEPETADAARRLSPIEALRAMPRAQKLILAGKADRATRVLLIRDVDPQVLFYVCKNPRITLDEILEITRLGTLNAQVADLIATSAQWMQNEQVKLNLVQNPKTPTPTALKLISGLNIRHLQAMAKSWNIRPQIKQAALKLVIERGGR
ncbi:MAG: hypothetical protein Q8T13_17940 [Acidobacteriota bacterium]|nr:hypothetical protein [Acidobacteriota bacterium]